ncbi:MAG: hypothetical protein IPJ01_11950 [Micavibrio sp.]|nr:hypothetical protein [Micavibrio sp.]
MAKKKVTKRKNSPEDKAIKAKPTGLRFKTKDVEALHKKDGSLNKKGEKLYFSRPDKVLTKKEISKFKRKADGSFESDTKQIYHESRKDKKHSDDNLTKQYKDGDVIKQNPAQSKSYSKKDDKGEKAKPVGKRYTTKLAKKLHKRPNEVPTKKDIEKYSGETVKGITNGVYDEKRKDKSDVSLTKKLEEGGEATVEISCEELKALLGREPKYPRDFANGKKYEKCFLRPFYRCCD